MDWTNSESVGGSEWFKGFKNRVKGVIIFEAQRPDIDLIEVVAIRGGPVSQLERKALPHIIAAAVKDLEGKVDISLLGDAHDTKIKLLLRELDYQEFISRFYDYMPSPLSPSGLCILATNELTQENVLEGTEDLPPQLSKPDSDAITAAREDVSTNRRNYDRIKLSLQGLRVVVAAGVRQHDLLKQDSTLPAGLSNKDKQAIDVAAAEMVRQNQVAQEKRNKGEQFTIELPRFEQTISGLPFEGHYHFAELGLNFEPKTTPTTPGIGVTSIAAPVVSSSLPLVAVAAGAVAVAAGTVPAFPQLASDAGGKVAEACMLQCLPPILKGTALVKIHVDRKENPNFDVQEVRAKWPMHEESVGWQREDAVSECNQCKKAFGRVRGCGAKHHCHQCGQVFCDACSQETHDYEFVDSPLQHRPYTGSDQYRVCDGCKEKLESGSVGPRAEYEDFLDDTTGPIQITFQKVIDEPEPEPEPAPFDIVVQNGLDLVPGAGLALRKVVAAVEAAREVNK